MSNHKLRWYHGNVFVLKLCLLFLGGGENDKKDLFFDLDGTLIDKVDFSELVKRKIKRI